MTGPTDEHDGIHRDIQDVVKAEYALQGKFGHRSGEIAFEMTTATMPDVEIEVSDAIVDECSFSVVNRTLY